MSVSIFDMPSVITSFVMKNVMIKYMILAKCSDMNEPVDTSGVGIVLQLCLQREKRLATPLWQHEVEEMLTIIYIE